MSINVETNKISSAKTVKKPVSVPQQQTKCTAFKGTQAKKEEGMSSEDKLLLTLGGLALAGIGIYLACKKGNNNTIKKAANTISETAGNSSPKMEDTAAKTMKEAAETLPKNDTPKISKVPEVLTPKTPTSAETIDAAAQLPSKTAAADTTITKPISKNTIQQSSASLENSAAAESKINASVSGNSIQKAESTVSEAINPAATEIQPQSEKITKIIKFRDKESGEIKDAVVTFSKLDWGKELVTVECNGKLMASGKITPDYLSQFDKDFLDMGIGQIGAIKKLGNCTYIDLMESRRRGGGTIFHKAVVERSKELGFEGRVALEAAWASPPFHYTCGFRDLNDDGTTSRIKEIEKIIEEYKKTRQRIKQQFRSYNMFLTEEMANKLLNMPL